MVAFERSMLKSNATVSFICVSVSLMQLLSAALTSGVGLVREARAPPRGSFSARTGFPTLHNVPFERSFQAAISIQFSRSLKAVSTRRSLVDAWHSANTKTSPYFLCVTTNFDLFCTPSWHEVLIKMGADFTSKSQIRHAVINYFLFE